MWAPAGGAGAVALRWKGQPVSFCSLSAVASAEGRCSARLGGGRVLDEAVAQVPAAHVLHPGLELLDHLDDAAPLPQGAEDAPPGRLVVGAEREVLRMSSTS
jgi:hypothetical protein